MDGNRVQIKKICLDDYTIKQTLGAGSFGRVKLIHQKSKDKYYALKSLAKAKVLKLQQVDHLLSEISILSMIDHPFLVKMYGIAQNERYLFIILELVQGGELYTHLRTLNCVKNEEAIFYAAQVTLMMEYLHSLNIAYRDLKPENLLIDSNGYLKLTDFGFSKIVETRTYTLCGTPEYLAPEVLMQKGHGKPVDWWCLGVLIYEMLAGIDPFADDNPLAIYENIMKGKVKFPATFNKEAKSLVKHLLVHDLGKRFGNLKRGVQDIKEHRWFKGFSWVALIKQQIMPIYIPKITNPGDTSNFQDHPGSPEPPSAIGTIEDPFLKW